MFQVFSELQFVVYFFSRFFNLMANLILHVVLAQSIYEKTRSPFALGLLGLAFFVPKVLVTLFAGQVADLWNRVRVTLGSRFVKFLMMGLLSYLILKTPATSFAIYLCVAFIAAAHAFEGPSFVSLLPDLVSKKNFPQAVSWNSFVQQTCFVLGPILAGLLYAWDESPRLALLVLLALQFVGTVLPSFLRDKNFPRTQMTRTWRDAFQGIVYVKQNRLLLGLISLDLFAVLFGGAVALLPFYANEVLHVGASGLGILRSGPAVGALLMSLFLAKNPIQKKMGETLLISVGIFGFSTIGFALSENLFFSFLCLVILGMADMVSMFLRGMAVPQLTPAHLLGRVSAVNQVFIGASNELGEFESGMTAALFGLVPACVFGGVATLGVVALWLKIFPELAQAKTFETQTLTL